MVISEFKGQLKSIRETETIGGFMGRMALVSRCSKLPLPYQRTKEKCLSELQIEPNQLSTEKLTRGTIDKLFSFMTDEEIRIRRLKDSLDVKKENVNFYGQMMRHIIQ